MRTVFSYLADIFEEGFELDLIGFPDDVDMTLYFNEDDFDRLFECIDETMFVELSDEQLSVWRQQGSTLDGLIILIETVLLERSNASNQTTQSSQ